jgi:hypothetical protein
MDHLVEQCPVRHHLRVEVTPVEDQSSSLRLGEYRAHLLSELLNRRACSLVATGQLTDLAELALVGCHTDAGDAELLRSQQDIQVLASLVGVQLPLCAGLVRQPP